MHRRDFHEEPDLVVAAVDELVGVRGLRRAIERLDALLVVAKDGRGEVQERALSDAARVIEPGWYSREFSYDARVRCP